MWQRICVLIMCLSFGADAYALQYRDDDPTVADNLREDFETFLRARELVAHGTAEFNARIIKARRVLKNSAANTPARTRAEQNYADVMYAKDLYYADQFLYEGFTENARRMEQGLPFLAGGAVDGGIPEDGRAEFEAWVVGLRKSMGAVGSQRLFKGAVSQERIFKALQENEGLYRKYKVLRDQQDRNGGASQRQLAERARLDNARKDADAARQADGSAGLYKQEIVPLDVNVWRVMLETPPLRKALFAAARKGQQALRCTYGPTLNDGGQAVYGEYFFWYRAPPPNIAELVAMDTRGALRHLGREGLAQCPSSDNRALAQLRRGMERSVGTTTPAAGSKKPPSPQCAAISAELQRLRGAAANDPHASTRSRTLMRNYAAQGCSR
jgi:hypothetical protein